VFRLAQTVPDYLGVLVQMGGSPFDCAGRGSTDRMRMACKRPGVRVPLAPPQINSISSNTKPIVVAALRGCLRGGSFPPPALHGACST
jgi:hypothetical protein